MSYKGPVGFKCKLGCLEHEHEKGTNLSFIKGKGASSGAPFPFIFSSSYQGYGSTGPKLVVATG